MAAVGDFDIALIVHLADLDGAGEIFELPEGGVGRPVGPDDTVGTEVGIVGLVPEVSAVAPVLFAVGGSFGDTVVQPLPDESPLNTGKSFKGVKVVGKTAVAVAHGV